MSIQFSPQNIDSLLAQTHNTVLLAVIYASALKDDYRYICQPFVAGPSLTLTGLLEKSKTIKTTSDVNNTQEMSSQTSASSKSESVDFNYMFTYFF